MCGEVHVEDGTKTYCVIRFSNPLPDFVKWGTGDESLLTLPGGYRRSLQMKGEVAQRKEELSWQSILEGGKMIAIWIP